MRLVFWIFGTLGVTCGIGLFVGTGFGKLGGSPPAGFTAGGFVLLAGVAHLLAGVKHYRGHWAFVTGIVLVTLGLCSLGALGGEEIPFQLFLAAAFTTFGLLSLWSGHKLHKCTLQLEQIATGAAAVFEGGQATC